MRKYRANKRVSPDTGSELTAASAVASTLSIQVNGNFITGALGIRTIGLRSHPVAVVKRGRVRAAVFIVRREDRAVARVVSIADFVLPVFTLTPAIDKDQCE